MSSQEATAENYKGLTSLFLSSLRTSPESMPDKMRPSKGFAKLFESWLQFRTKGHWPERFEKAAKGFTTDQSTHAILYIPDFLYKNGLMTGIPSGTAKNATASPSILAKQLAVLNWSQDWVEELTDKAFEKVLSEKESTGNELVTTVQPIQAYIISELGAMRIFERSNRPPDQVKKLYGLLLPASTYFPARTYFASCFAAPATPINVDSQQVSVPQDRSAEHFFSFTKPYLDLGGNGVVVTASKGLIYHGLKFAVCLDFLYRPSEYGSSAANEDTIQRAVTQLASTLDEHAYSFQLTADQTGIHAVPSAGSDDLSDELSDLRTEIELGTKDAAAQLPTNGELARSEEAVASELSSITVFDPKRLVKLDPNLPNIHSTNWWSPSWLDTRFVGPDCLVTVPIYGDLSESGTRISSGRVVAWHMNFGKYRLNTTLIGFGAMLSGVVGVALVMFGAGTEILARRTFSAASISIAEILATSDLPYVKVDADDLIVEHNGRFAELVEGEVKDLCNSSRKFEDLIPPDDKASHEVYRQVKEQRSEGNRVDAYAIRLQGSTGPTPVEIVGFSITEPERQHLPVRFGLIIPESLATDVEGLLRDQQLG